MSTLSSRLIIRKSTVSGHAQSNVKLHRSIYKTQHSI